MSYTVQTHHNSPPLRKIMIPFWTLPPFLFLCSLGYVESCTPDTRCAIDVSTSQSFDAFSSLEVLQCAMDAEIDAVMSGESIREPPYEYKLCPGIRYIWEESLIPRLNGTKIFCASSASCLVSTQVQLSRSDVNVTFQDLTFNGSVVASAPSGSFATFVNCNWKNQPRVIDISNDSPSSMHVNLLNCVIEDFDPSTNDQETFGLRSLGGSLTIRNLTVNSYNVSKFLDMRDGASVYIKDSVFSNSFLKDPLGYKDFIFANDSMLTFDNVLAIDNKVSNFVWLQKSAFAHVKDFHYSNQFRSGHVFRLTSANGLLLQDSELTGGNYANSLIMISEPGPTLEVKGTIFNLTEPNHAIWSYSNVSITDSCLYGSSKDSPILLSDGSQISYHNVFTKVQVPEEECGGITHELIDGTKTCTEVDSTTDCRPNPKVYPPAPSCFTGEGEDLCPIVPSIGKCASTLLELRCIICGEASAVANGAVLRSPPYTYTLCSNTTFMITDESQETIFPIMDNTKIVCGDSLTDTCTIESGKLQVEVGTPRNENDFRAFEDFEPKHVEFHRIHFKSSQYNEEYLLTSSIWNHGRDNEVIFENCTWTDELGSYLIVNGGESSNASNMNLTDCKIQNLSMSRQETSVLLSRSGGISMFHTDIEDSYLSGGLATISEDSTLLWMDSSLLNCSSSAEFITLMSSSSSPKETGQLTISNVSIEENNYGESFLNIVGGGTASIQDSKFVSNQGAKTISILASALVRPLVAISNSNFDDETLQDGLIIAVGADVEVRACSFTNISSTGTAVEASQNTKLDFSSVCFLEGSYSNALIFVDRLSNLYEDQVYGDGINYKSGCDGVLYQAYEEDEFSETTECTPILPGTGCMIERPPPPSRPPSRQPTMRPSASTAMPTFSPTEAPSERGTRPRSSSAANMCWNWTLVLFSKVMVLLIINL